MQEGGRGIWCCCGGRQTRLVCHRTFFIMNHVSKSFRCSPPRSHFIANTNEHPVQRFCRFLISTRVISRASILIRALHIAAPTLAHPAALPRFPPQHAPSLRRVTGMMTRCLNRGFGPGSVACSHQFRCSGWWCKVRRETLCELCAYKDGLDAWLK
jgi:hypothetical protein